MAPSVSGARDTGGKRPESRDTLLLALLLAVWVVCFGLQLRSLLHPTRYPYIGVRADAAGGHPTVINFYPGAGGDLQRGDRLIRVGATDLRGLGPLGFWVHYVAESTGDRSPRLIYERGDRRGETFLPEMLWRRPAVRSVRLISLGFCFVALVLFFRGPGTAFAAATSRALLIWGIHFALPFSGGVVLTYAGIALHGVFAALAHPVVVKAVQSFPSGRLPTSLWARYGPWLFAILGPLVFNVYVGVPFTHPIGIALFQLVEVAFLATILLLIARGYRRTDAVGRRQFRWVVFGFYAGLTPIATLMGLELIDRTLTGGWVRFYPWVAPSGGFVVLIPISFLFAMIRYNLFDVDRLLSATASYNIVLVILIGTGLLIVPFVGDLSSRLFGFDPRVGQAAVALLLAAIAIPAQRRLRPRIERVFFKQRYALDRAIAELVRTLSTCENTRTLAERVGKELQRLLAPEACVVYARAGEAFTPVFAAGQAVPPAFETGSPLVATLAQRNEPLALSADGRRPDAAELGPFDRAALEALDAEVVIPVRRDETLLAFLCLGPKRSGDVYTSTDLSQLALVAETVSGQLRRFDQEEVIREARAMQESLRRYVPGAVAEKVVRREELAPGEREVTVLFVDLRGYTRLAEGLRPEDVFATINEHTERVSRLVQESGGTIVEFNGDGMMAVFGAPEPLARKELHAVEAARKIVDSMPATLSVGVGVATGSDFVGSIRASDRFIWTVLGSTTNLASRLQSLTREIDAAIAIDETTRERAGYVCADFVRHAGVEIRGRRQPLDLHALPLAGS